MAPARYPFYAESDAGAKKWTADVRVPVSIVIGAQKWYKIPMTPDQRFDRRCARTSSDDERKRGAS